MTDRNEYPDRIFEATATIANGATVSGAVDLGGCTLVGVRTPAALTGTAMTFQVADDAGTYLALYGTDGNAVSFTVAASRHIKLNPDDFVSGSKIKVVSGSAEAAERIITLLVRP